MAVFHPYILILALLTLVSCRTPLSEKAKLKDDTKSLPDSPAILLDPSVLPQSSIRDLVIFNHFDPSKLAGRTIGIESEMGGISPQKAIDVLVQELGGNFVGEITHGTEKAYLIKDSSIGDIRVEPVNLMRILNRINQTNPNALTNKGFLKSFAETSARSIDYFVGTFEIVLPPLDYAGVVKYSKVLDKLGLAGAKGTSNLGRLVSQQINIGINHTDARLLKNILRNYYANRKGIRKDVSPAVLRRMYLGSISQEFIGKLNDPNWQPSVSELFDWYSKHSPPKLARLNLYNALINNTENAERVEQSTTGAKERLGRPVAEFREGNMYLSNLSDPTRGSRHLIYEMQFALAMVFASEANIEVSHVSEVKRASDYLNKMLVERAKTEKLRPEIFEKMKLEPVSATKKSLQNKSLLAELDPILLRGEDLRAVLRNSANQDSLGRKVTAIENFLIPTSDSTVADLKVRLNRQRGVRIVRLEEGRSSENAYKEYINGEMLAAIGVATERVLQISPNGKSTDKVDVVKYVPGHGTLAEEMRNWSKAQTFESLALLRQTAEAETGRVMTNSTYMLYEIFKTAKVAARLQHHFVMIDATSQGKSGLYPGCVYARNVRFAQIPDPNLTSLTTGSVTFSGQAQNIRKVLQKRVAALTRADRNLKKINLNRAYQAAFNYELGVLSLQRLGLNFDQAHNLYKSRKEKVDLYVDRLWRVQFNRLGTDVNALQFEIAKVYAGGEVDAKKLEEAERRSSSVNRESLRTRQNFVRKFFNKLKNRSYPVNSSEVKLLYESAAELLAVAEMQTRSESFRENLVSNAQKVQAVSFFTPAEVQEVIQSSSSGPIIEFSPTSRKRRPLIQLNNCDSLETGIGF